MRFGHVWEKRNINNFYIFIFIFFFNRLTGLLAKSILLAKTILLQSALGCAAKDSQKSELKGSGHFWQLLKIIIGTKPYLVMSNGERLVV